MCTGGIICNSVFDDINKEYVITTPETPLPWINYLGCENFSVLRAIPAEDTVSIRMPSCSDSQDIAIIILL